MSVYSPTDAAGIIAAAAAAGPGDFVGIPAGTFDCTSAPLAWKPGAMVQGAGMGRTVIQGQVQSSLANNRYPLVLKRLTFDSAGLSPVGVGVNEFFDGQVILIDTEFKNGASGTLLRFNANTYPVIAKMSRCVVHDSPGDCISTSAASQTYGEQSKLSCYECKSYTAGGGANDQALTSHVYFRIDWFGGYLANAAAQGQTVAQADEFCPIRIYGATIVHGNNSAAVQCDTLLFCDLSSTTGDDEMVRVYNVAEANRLYQLRLGIHGAAGGKRWLVGNVFEDASINVEDVNGTWSGITFIRGNLVQGRTGSGSGGDVGIQVYSGYGPATVYIENNVVREHYRLVMVSSVGNPVVKFRNNLLYQKHASGKCVYFYTGGGGAITLSQYSGYNHLYGYDALDGYTLQTGDVTTKPTPAEVAAWESRLPRTTWDRATIQEAMDALDRYRPEIEPTYLGPAIRDAVAGAEMDLVDAPNATAVAVIQSGLATGANQTTILNRLGAWTGTGINTILGAFQSLLSKAASAPSDIGGTFIPSTDSVEAIRDRGDEAWIGSMSAGDIRDAIGMASANMDVQLSAIQASVDSIEGGTGSGARTVPIIVDDGTEPLESATVRLTMGATTYVGHTDVDGEVTFNIDDGTWTVAITLSGYAFAGTILAVSGDVTRTYSMTQVSFSPSDPGYVTGYYYCYDEEGNVEEGVDIQVQFYNYTGTGIVFDKAIRTETSDSNGLVQFTNLLPGAKYKIRRGTSGKWTIITISSSATTPYAMTSFGGLEDA